VTAGILGFQIVVVSRRLPPFQFFYRRCGVFSRYKTRVEDNDEYQPRKGPYDQEEENEEQNKQGNGGS
jgi:hypothetical protein